MNKRKTENRKILRRKARARAKLFGTAQRPRISIFKSNTHVYLQAIDDTDQKTVASVSTRGEIKGATKLAEALATKMKEKKIISAVFDRGAHQYHGFIKNLAEEIRKNGIKI